MEVYIYCHSQDRFAAKPKLVAHTFNLPALVDREDPVTSACTYTSMFIEWGPDFTAIHTSILKSPG